MMSFDDHDHMTATAAARQLGVSTTRLRQLVETGRLPVALRTPHGRLYLTKDVEQLAADRARRLAQTPAAA